MDAGTLDAGTRDAGPDDAGPDDAGPDDAGPDDAGPTSQVPGAPTGIVATPGNAEVTVTWTAPVATGSSAISAYTLTAQPGAHSKTVAASETQATFTGLVNGTEYTFTVTATNVAGTGAASSAVSATPRTVPGAPLALAATPGMGQVGLTWGAPSGNGGSPITGYVVTVRAGTTVVKTQPAAANATSATVTGLTNGTSYTFTVAATNEAGTGAESAPADATPRTVPGAPTGVVATPGAQKVSLKWDARASDGGSPITGYTVTTRRGTTVVDTQTPSGTSVTVLGLTNGTSYSFTVTANNVAGAGAASAPVEATPRTFPSAPTNVQAAPGNAQVTVSWSAPSSDGGSPITGYIVAITRDGTEVKRQTAPANATSATVTGLTNGAVYAASVWAINAAGDGNPSGNIVFVPRTVPGAPTGLVATPGNTQVSLSWTAPAGDGGAGLTGYVVTIRTGTTVIGTQSSSTTSATVTGLTNGQTYDFTVAATNSEGTGSSSAPVSATPRTVPGVPTDVWAFPGSAQVEMTWTAPTNDGGSAITGYVVTVRHAGSNMVVATPSFSTTSGTVTGLTNGTTYNITVAAVNAAGRGAESLAYGVTPAAPPGAPTNVRAAAMGGTVVARWTAPASDGGAAISWYTVSVSPGGMMLSVPGSETTATLAGLPLASGYTLTVRASNLAGEGPASVASAPFKMDCLDSGFPGRPLSAVLGATDALVHDLTGDGRGDLVLMGRDPSDFTPAILVYPSGGRYLASSPIIHRVPASYDRLVLANFNNDGRQDILAYSSGDPRVMVLLSQTDRTFAPAVTTPFSSTVYALNIGDFTGDGRLDLVFTTGNSSTQIWVAPGRGDGTFQTPIVSTGAGVGFKDNIGVGDVNRDGKLDVVFSGNSEIGVLLGDGQGQLYNTGTAYPAGSSNAPLVSADFNADGAADVAVVNNDLFGVEVLTSNGSTATFTAADYHAMVATTPITGLRAADFNRDGVRDLLLLNSTSATVAVMRGKGNGTFEDAVPYVTVAGVGRQVTGDIDADGNLDVALLRPQLSPTSPTDAVDLVFGRGDGTLERPALIYGPDAFYTAVGDLDSDGRMDVASAYSSTTVTLWKGNGNGTLTAAPSFTSADSTSGVLVSDLDGDGRADLAMGNSGGATVSVALGQANGTLGTRADYSVGGRVSGPFESAGDINGDGRLDLAVPIDVFGTYRVAVLLGTAGGTFSAASAYDVGGTINGLVLADLNGDNRADVIAWDSNSRTLRVKWGRADGGLEATQTLDLPVLVKGINVGDFDGSGRPDIAVSDPLYEGIHVRLNDGSGGFGTVLTSPGAAASLASNAGDVNGDGRPDLVMFTNNTASGGRMWVMLGLGDGTFARTGTTYPASTTTSGTLRLGDMNGDGRLDLIGSIRQYGVFVLPQVCY